MKHLMIFEDFTRLYDRWKGGDVRKEDQFNPEYVDFGESTNLYWTKYNIEIDGQSKFTWEEIKDYTKNGWRLPTHEEVNNMYWKSSNVTYGDITLEAQLVTDSGESGTFIINDSVHRFFAWTTTPNDNFNNYAYGFGVNLMGRYLNTYIGKSEKSYVILVKEKDKVKK